MKLLAAPLMVALLCVVTTAQARITSYNVCYTKLLRVRRVIATPVLFVLEPERSVGLPVIDELGSHDPARLDRFALIVENFVGNGKPIAPAKIPVKIVITSYSIHYTKLYDSACGQSRLLPDGGATWLSALDRSRSYNFV